MQIQTPPCDSSCVTAEPCLIDGKEALAPADARYRRTDKAALRRAQVAHEQELASGNSLCKPVAVRLGMHPLRVVRGESLLHPERALRGGADLQDGGKLKLGWESGWGGRGYRNSAAAPG